jgi:hypothetical protein
MAPDPAPTTTDERGSALLRMGAAAGAGAVAAIACVLPAALRVASSSGEPGVLRACVALASCALVPMIASVAVLRGARSGIRSFVGPDAGLRLYGVGLWLATLLVGLTMFASVLRATTHHHALAGVTFAFGALAFAVGSALVCARVVAIARALPDAKRRLLLGALSAAVGLLLVVVGLRFVRAASKDDASYAAAGTVVDVLAFLLAALLAARLRPSLQRPLALFGPPVAVAVAILGMVALREPSVHDAVTERAPAFAPAADALGGR